MGLTVAQSAHMEASRSRAKRARQQHDRHQRGQDDEDRRHRAFLRHAARGVLVDQVASVLKPNGRSRIVADSSLIVSTKTSTAAVRIAGLSSGSSTCAALRAGVLAEAAGRFVEIGRQLLHARTESRFRPAPGSGSRRRARPRPPSRSAAGRCEKPRLGAREARRRHCRSGPARRAGRGPVCRRAARSRSRPAAPVAAMPCERQSRTALMRNSARPTVISAVAVAVVRLLRKARPSAGA